MKKDTTLAPQKEMARTSGRDPLSHPAVCTCLRLKPHLRRTSTSTVLIYIIEINPNISEDTKANT